jgi:plasmid stabilization system protein ParE
MSLRVVVRPSAETDLLESALFIAGDDPAAARRFLDEAEEGTYTTGRADHIDVLRVLHGARDSERFFE